MSENPVSSCFLCNIREDCKLCTACKLVYTCTAHEPVHSSTGIGCLPWRVDSLDGGVERKVVAVRNIQPMELILHNEPFALAPIEDSEPVCLQCFRKLDNIKTVKCKCGFPMCSQKCCSGRRHEAECKIYTQASAQFESNDEYQMIMPIRMLSQLEEEPSWHSIYDLLMDHKQERETENDKWNRTEDFVIKPIHEKLKKTEWTSEMIHRCVGVSRTNACNLTATGIQPGEEVLDDSEIGLSRVIYLYLAFINNSCIPNCTTIHHPNYSMTVRTMRQVKKGEELTISYSGLLAGRLQRRQDFIDNWFFQCKCVRCEDVTDVGTNFDTHLCGSGCGGHVLPHQIESEAIWFCTLCKKEKTFEETKLKEKNIADLLGSISSTDDLEGFLKTYEFQLHANHNLMIKAKIALVNSYKTIQSRKPLQRKVDLCGSLLSVIGQLFPGFWEIRGRLLYEQAVPIFIILQMDFQEQRIQVEEFKSNLGDITINLEDCLTCLQGQAEGTYGFYIHGKAKQILSNVKEMVQFADFL